MLNLTDDEEEFDIQFLDDQHQMKNNTDYHERDRQVDSSSNNTSSEKQCRPQQMLEGKDLT